MLDRPVSKRLRIRLRTASAWLLHCTAGALLSLLGCAAQQSSAPKPKQPASINEQDAKALGAKAGVVSPRLADCSEHCATMLGDAKESIDDARRADFTESCCTACEAQIADAQRLWTRAKSEAGAWRELYLMAGLLEQHAWCIQETKDQSSEAHTFLAAFDALKRAPSALAADEAERKAQELGSPVAQTPEGQRVIALRRELADANAQNPRSPRADEVRAAIDTADQAARATPPGQLWEAASHAAQLARRKLNEGPEMAEAARTWDAHQKSMGLRFRAATPAEQAAMGAAWNACLDSLLEKSMRRSGHSDPR